MKTREIDKMLIDSFIEINPVHTFEELKTISGCKSITLYRKIKSNNLLVSYNQNAKFYTVSKLAHFNHHGIWNYQQILFSKYGNLFETIIVLVNNSIKGYTAKEMAAIIKVKADDALRILWQKNRVERQKTGGNNVYYSSNPELFGQQLLARKQQTPIVLHSLILPDNQAVIAVLVAIIQQDSLDSQILHKAIKRQKIDISIDQVQSVIVHYQLKKKTNK